MFSKVENYLGNVWLKDHIVIRHILIVVITLVFAVVIGSFVDHFFGLNEIVHKK